MGISSTESGDYFGGQEANLSALPYFNLKDKKQYIYINSNYHNLGLATQYLRNYDRGIELYQSSLSYALDMDSKWSQIISQK